MAVFSVRRASDVDEYVFVGNAENLAFDDLVEIEVPFLAGDIEPRLIFGNRGGGLVKEVFELVIKLQVADEGAVDQYSLKLIYRPASWILGDPVYSILGQTTILGENVAN